MDTALTLTNDMKLVLGLVGFTMAMFLFERIRADVVALVVLVVLGVTGLIAPEEIFGGFSGNAVMSIIATTILGAGLDRTGALNRLAAWLLRRGHGVEQRLLMMTTAIADRTPHAAIGLESVASVGCAMIAAAGVMAIATANPPARSRRRVGLGIVVIELPSAVVTNPLAGVYEQSEDILCVRWECRCGA